MENITNNPKHKRQGKDREKKAENEAQKLYKALYTKPISRRMAATFIGYLDQTYMVTQLIYDWLKDGKAQIVGKIKCSRSGRLVEAVTTNPAFFQQDKFKQLNLFDDAE